MNQTPNAQPAYSWNPGQQQQVAANPINLGYYGAGQALGNIAPPPAPTRFTTAAGRLQDRLADYASFVDRLNRVADRLGGAVPAELAGGKKDSNSGCVAAMLDSSLDDFDNINHRMNSILERLESL